MKTKVAVDPLDGLRAVRRAFRGLEARTPGEVEWVRLLRDDPREFMDRMERMEKTLMMVRNQRLKVVGELKGKSKEPELEPVDVDEVIQESPDEVLERIRAEVEGVG